MWDIVLPPQPNPKTCYSPKGTFPIILGLAIVFGQFLAFAPQLYSIISKKHVEGINLLTYLLGTVSCTAVFLSGLIESWGSMFCCKVITPWHCVVSLIDFMQVGVNWLNYFMIFCLLATYVKNTQKKPTAKLQFRLSLCIYIAWGVLGGWLITFTFLLYGGTPAMSPSTTGIYNKILGLIGVITIILQWSPQIVTTFLHKGPGALSPITLSINAPGSMLTAFSLITGKKSASVWLPYVLSGTQQAIIVALIIYFKCCGKTTKQIEDLLENDPGFQGPALLLEDDESNDENDNEDNDGLTGGRGHRDGEEYASSGFMGDDGNFSASSAYDSEEDAEEEGTEDEADPHQQLIRKRRNRSASRRIGGGSSTSIQGPDHVPRSVPAYHALNE